MSTSVEFKFDCGDRVKDSVTGWEGMVVSMTFHLNKCIRYGVQPQQDKKAPTEMPAVYGIDEDQLVLVKAGAVKMVKPQVKTGGPFDEPRLARGDHDSTR